MRVSEASVDPNAVVVSFGGEEEPSIDVHTLHRRYLPAAVGPLHRFFSKFGGIEPGAVLDDGDDDDDDDDDDDRYDDVDDESRGPGTVALDEISLHVSGAGCVALVGPRGCGKSVLLRAIAGITPPTSGRIVVRGATAPAFDLFIKVMPRTGKVRDAVVSLAVAVGISARRARRALPDVCELLGDPELPSRWNSHLSIETRRDLVLATFLSLDSDILLLDIPISDGPVGERCRDRIRELKQTGTLVIVSGNSLDEVEWIADRVLTMRRGRLVGAEDFDTAFRRAAVGDASDSSGLGDG